MINENDNLLELEQSLRTRLSPVRPDRDFVGNLQQRLEQSPIFQKKRHLAVTLLTVAGGLVIGTAVFLIGRELIEGTRKS
ncbi:MAG TPA: hypothetical protein DF984_05310 [Anaerolineaceae bacterium]|jgi:hypothetical protein|nr:hypothetical protein [Anaerolineaceae bacterium]